MKRRDFLRTTGGALALAGSSSPAHSNAAPAASNANRPNILHIMSDQQQWATIVGRSECNTPNLNRLASQGVVFERSYTPCAICCPSRAMMVSGAWHWHNGVYNQVHSAPSVSRDMLPDVVTYSMRLKEAGYRMGYVGKWHASYARTPFDFGYDEYGAPMGVNPALIRGMDLPDERRHGGIKHVPVRKMSWPGSEPFTMWGYLEGEEENTNCWGVAETGIKMLERFTAGQQPWELEIHFIEPHDAYMPLKKYLDRYDKHSIPVARSFREETFTDKPGQYRMESESWGKITEDDYQASRAHYYAYAEMLDAQIGRILDALDKSGQADNTLVVCTTDHGDMVGSHRMWIKGVQPYEECYRVPLIMRWPGRIDPGSVNHKLVQTHDLGYTYVEAAGAGKMPFDDGRSLAPLFNDPEPANWPDHIMSAYYGGEYIYTQRMVTTERYKYVFNGFDIDECYDLQEDPDELRNMVYDGSNPAVVDDMRARLYELMDEYEDPFGDTQNRISIGQPPNRYGAPRFLPRGKRM